MQTQTKQTESDVSADRVTELILRIFKANGRLLLAGDRLVAPLGLSSARWQLLGSIITAERPQPVVRLAREMGVSRQAVQRLANEMEREGAIAFNPNPHHKRAQLLSLTPRGRELYRSALRLQRPWATRLAQSLTGLQVATACDALDLMVAHLNDERT